MSCQIIGTKKCRSTQKLERLLKELNIKYHFVSLNDRELSEGEWNNIFQFYSPSSLLDENSSSYKKKKLAFMDCDPKEELYEDNTLLKTPLLRINKKVYLDPSREMVISLFREN